MHLEQLRLLAKPFRTLLAERNFSLSHNQSLDYLAALAGLRNWPEANAMPERLHAAAADRAAAARLSRRVVAGGGPDIEIEVLLKLIRGDERLAVWADGPPPGIYVCRSEAAAAAAVRRYLEETGGELFFTDGICQSEDSAILLGEYGLSSPGLSRVARGTLVVSGPMELTEEAWEDNQGRMIAASNCASADLRVLMVCDTLDPGNLHRDLALLLRMDEAPGFVDHTLKGVVDADGTLRGLSEFVEPRARPGRQHLLPSPVSAPTQVIEELGAALALRSTGLLIASTAASHESSRWTTIASLFPVLATLGRVAIVVEHTRGSYGRERPRPECIVDLPVYTSVESAIVDDCKVIIVEWPSNPTKTHVAAHLDTALFVFAGNDLNAGSAYFHHYSDDDNERLDALIGIVCAAGLAGELKGQQLWNLYRRGPDTIAALGAHRGTFDAMDFLDKHRMVRWEQSYQQLHAAGLIDAATFKQAYRNIAAPPRLKGKTKAPAKSVEA